MVALPVRLFSAMPPLSSMSIPSLKAMSFPSSKTIFKPVHAGPTAAISAITSPYVLTRREMLSSRKALTVSRDDTARKVGFLALHGPQLGGGQEDIEQSFTHADLLSETTRVYETICQALQVQLAPPSRRSRSSHSPPSLRSTANPTSLVQILTTHLPRAKSSIDKTLTIHKRPSFLMRYWFPLLFLPPAVYTAVQTFAKNKDWMKEQVVNAKETVRGFVVQWVWEPLEGIGKTIRGGGEGLGVAPTTVQSDQDSLERMVLDLGRDYYKLSGPQLEDLGRSVKAGDMEQVLRVYEREMQVSPIVVYS
jgi:nuclear-control-of-ATPase protein 2